MKLINFILYPFLKIPIPIERTRKQFPPQEKPRSFKKPEKRSIDSFAIPIPILPPPSHYIFPHIQYPRGKLPARGNPRETTTHSPLPLCSRPCDYRGIRGINKAARAFRGTARKKATAGRYTHTMWYSRERTGKAITLPLPRAPGLRLFLGRVPPERGTRERGREVVQAPCEKMPAATDLKIVQVGNRRLRRAPRRESACSGEERCREATTIGRVPKSGRGPDRPLGPRGERAAPTAPTIAAASL